MKIITSEITKEQLQQIEAAAKEVLWPVVWSEKKACEHFVEKITPQVVLELVRIALASLEAEPAAGGYQPAIDILRDRAARELDGGFRSHHNALIYAANELENAQAFGQEVSHES
ncbi:hypothetical protein J4X85_24410 [Escherichia coli]